MRPLLWLCCKPFCFAGTVLWTSLRLYCALLGIFYFVKGCKPVKVKGRLSGLYLFRNDISSRILLCPTIEVHLHSSSCFLCKLHLKLSGLTFCRRVTDAWKEPDDGNVWLQVQIKISVSGAFKGNATSDWVLNVWRENSNILHGPVRVGQETQLESVLLSR